MSAPFVLKYNLYPGSLPDNELLDLGLISTPGIVDVSSLRPDFCPLEPNLHVGAEETQTFLQSWAKG